MSFKIEQAKESDLEDIFNIYHWYIKNSVATMDSELYDLAAQKKWFLQFDPIHPIWKVTQEGRLCGWGCLKMWSDRVGYKNTVELSIYFHEKSTNTGFGSLLVREILSFAEKHFRVVLLRINAESAKSIRFYKRFGFEDIGTMRSVGDKFGHEHDVHIMQKVL